MNYYVAFKNPSSISCTLERNFVFQCLHFFFFFDKLFFNAFMRRGHLALYGENMQCSKKVKIAYDRVTLNPSSQLWEQALQCNHLLLYSFFCIRSEQKKACIL